MASRLTWVATSSRQAPTTQPQGLNDFGFILILSNIKSFHPWMVFHSSFRSITTFDHFSRIHGATQSSPLRYVFAQVQAKGDDLLNLIIFSFGHFFLSHFRGGQGQRQPIRVKNSRSRISGRTTNDDYSRGIPVGMH